MPCSRHDPFFIILSFASRAAAQDMELYIEPDKCYLGGEVRLFGFVKPDAKGSADIKVDFKKPVSGQTIIRQLKTDSNGEFELFFSETYEIGNWEVTLSKKTAINLLKNISWLEPLFLWRHWLKTCRILNKKA